MHGYVVEVICYYQPDIRTSIFLHRLTHINPHLYQIGISLLVGVWWYTHAMKRLYIIHRWSGNSQEPLLQWIKEQATLKGFEVHIPDMPLTDTPNINNWVTYIRDVVGYIDENTYFIGHSIGAQAILRYLQEPDGVDIGGAIFIAPWLTLMGIDSPIDQDIIRPWLENPIDFAKINKLVHSPGRFVSIFSDNDPYVPLVENRDAFEKKLQPKVIVEKGKGHFEETDGVTSLPSVVAELERILLK